MGARAAVRSVLLGCLLEPDDVPGRRAWGDHGTADLGDGKPVSSDAGFLLSLEASPPPAR